MFASPDYLEMVASDVKFHKKAEVMIQIIEKHVFLAGKLYQKYFWSSLGIAWSVVHLPKNLKAPSLQDIKLSFLREMISNVFKSFCEKWFGML